MPWATPRAATVVSDQPGGARAMMLVLVMAAAIWVVGWAMKVPTRLRWGLIGLLYGAVVIAHLVLPEANPLRVATGGQAQPWLVLGLIAALGMGYRALLARLRARHQLPATDTAATQPLRAAELDRYARHIMLREIGGPGQVRLKRARVLVIGAGGLGSPAILYLAAAGVGTIGVVDDDSVDASNLQRQVIHTDARIGMPKVQSALAAVAALNPFVTVLPYQRRLDAQIAPALVADYDLVLDGTDSFATRAVVNAACVAARTPLISAAISQWEGQISLFDPARGGPCYACVFPTAPAPGLAPSCAEAGVMGALPGVIGAMMAAEAIKHITGAGTSLRGRMLIYDGLDAEARVMRLRADPACPICSGQPKP